MQGLLKLILFVCFVFFILLVGPWLIIWAINTLVAAGGISTFFIPFTFQSWLASAFLGGSVFFRTRRK